MSGFTKLPGGRAELKLAPAGMSLPQKISPVSRLVTIKSRSLTSLTPASGFAAGSVQTKVARSGRLRAVEETEMTRVRCSPVASASDGLCSNHNIGLPWLALLV